MGSNNLQTKNPGDVISTMDPNQYKTSLTGDIVPRNISGVPSNNAGSIGSSIYRWANGFFKSLNIGLPASAISIYEAAGELIIEVGGIIALKVSEFGWDGAFIEQATITPTKRETANKVSTSSLSNTSTTSTSYADMAGATLSITCSGVRPVYLTMEKGSFLHSGTASDWMIAFVKDGSIICEYTAGQNITLPMSAFTFIDPNPTAGSHTYKIQWKNVSAGTLQSIAGILTAMEL